RRRDPGVREDTCELCQLLSIVLQHVPWADRPRPQAVARPTVVGERASELGAVGSRVVGIGDQGRVTMVRVAWKGRGDYLGVPAGRDAVTGYQASVFPRGGE